MICLPKRFSSCLRTLSTMPKRTRTSSSSVAASPEGPKRGRPRKAAQPAPAADTDVQADEGNTQSDEGKTREKKRARSQPSSLPKEPVGFKYTSSMRPTPDTAGPSMTFMSWNVAGLRSLIKKDPHALNRLVELEAVDVLCLQEHKLQDKHVAEVQEALNLEGWATHWNCSAARAGYSGTALLVRKDLECKPQISFGIGVDDHDNEGRVCTLDLPDMYVVNVYVPNSGDGLKRLDYRVKQWDPAFSSYLNSLQATKPVVVTGDFNCAREPIDIHNARGNVKSAGFTPEERASFKEVYMDSGWVDTFREQHPEVHGYTYFSYRHNMRAKAKGWRLDYFLVSSALAPRCHDSFILTDFLGSDHCPVGLKLKASQ